MRVISYRAPVQGTTIGFRFKNYCVQLIRTPASANMDLAAAAHIRRRTRSESQTPRSSVIECGRQRRWGTCSKDNGDADRFRGAAIRETDALFPILWIRRCSYRTRRGFIRASGANIRNDRVRHMLVDKLATAMLHEEGPMRFKAYRDQNCSWHCDLVGKGDDPWSVDLIVESMSCILLGGFAYAMISLYIH